MVPNICGLLLHSGVCSFNTRFQDFLTTNLLLNQRRTKDGKGKGERNDDLTAVIKGAHPQTAQSATAQVHGWDADGPRSVLGTHQRQDSDGRIFFFGGLVDGPTRGREIFVWMLHAGPEV